jgi:hypothetical protein
VTESYTTGSSRSRRSVRKLFGYTVVNFQASSYYRDIFSVNKLLKLKIKSQIEGQKLTLTTTVILGAVKNAQIFMPLHVYTPRGGEKAVVTYFKVLSLYLLEETKKDDQ